MRSLLPKSSLWIHSFTPPFLPRPLSSFVPTPTSTSDRSRLGSPRDLTPNVVSMTTELWASRSETIGTWPVSKVVSHLHNLWGSSPPPRTQSSRSESSSVSIFEIRYTSDRRPLVHVNDHLSLSLDPSRGGRRQYHRCWNDSLLSLLRIWFFHRTTFFRVLGVKIFVYSIVLRTMSSLESNGCLREVYQSRVIREFYP